MSDHTQSESTHESPDVHSRNVLFSALIFASPIVIALLGIGAAFRVSDVPIEKFERLPLTQVSYPTPQLLTNPASEVTRMQARWQDRLTGYKWQDRQKKIVSIPIERAMEIVAGLGQKAYEPIATGNTGSGNGSDPNNGGGGSGSNGGGNSNSEGNGQ